MINQRKMIDALLWLEEKFWRLATLMELFLLSIGNGLKRLILGRRGPRLLSHREIYAKNIISYRASFGRNWFSDGIYIRRIGRHHSYRGIRVGQD